MVLAYMLFVMRVSDTLVLAVRPRRPRDVGLVGYEMAVLVDKCLARSRPRSSPSSRRHSRGRRSDRRERADRAPRGRDVVPGRVTPVPLGRAPLRADAAAVVGVGVFAPRPCSR